VKTIFLGEALSFWIIPPKPYSDIFYLLIKKTITEN